MKTVLFSTFILALVVGISGPSFAEEGQIVQCGNPLATDIDVYPHDLSRDFCDIYTRQLEYRKNRIEFREDLEERRVNFAAPSLEAYRTYRENLEALHNSKGGNNSY